MQYFPEHRLPGGRIFPAERDSRRGNLRMCGHLGRQQLRKRQQWREQLQQRQQREQLRQQWQQLRQRREPWLSVRLTDDNGAASPPRFRVENHIVPMRDCIQWRISA